MGGLSVSLYPCTFASVQYKHNQVRCQIFIWKEGNNEKAKAKDRDVEIQVKKKTILVYLANNKLRYGWMI